MTLNGRIIMTDKTQSVHVLFSAIIYKEIIIQYIIGVYCFYN